MGTKDNMPSVIAIEKTIQIFWQGEQICIQKDEREDLFDKVMDLIRAQNLEEIKKRFFEFKKELEKYTNGDFISRGGALYLKDDKDTPIPMMLAKRLREVYDNKQDYMPLVRFWNKLKNHPNAGVREDLYAFLSHNNIPITPLGNVICEKGVKEKEDGTLVDVHSGMFDNSIGMIVEMSRDEVDPDRNNECSRGFHVGAPDYVRNHWSSDIIVDCEVDPMDFVAIPKDYSRTKARVCKYKVIGLSDKSKKKPIYNKLEDTNPPTGKNLKKLTAKEDGKENDKYKDVQDDELDYNKMTGQAIIDYVKKETGRLINVSTKNKQSIIKRAQELLVTHKTSGKPAAFKGASLNVYGMSGHEILEMLDNMNIKLPESYYVKPWRGAIIKRANTELAEIGKKLVDDAPEGETEE